VSQMPPGPPEYPPPGGTPGWNEPQPPADGGWGAPPPTSGGWGAPPPGPGMPPPGGPGMPMGGPPPMGPPPGGNKNPALIIVLVVLVIGAVIGGAILLTSGDDDDEPTAGSTVPGQPGEPGDITLPEAGDTTLPSVSLPDIGDIGDVGSDEGGPPAEPPSDGGDATLGGYADSCYQGDMQACDDLFMESDSGSELEDYGDTCGRRFDVSHGFCVNALPNPEPPS
jgi:hypothetical protein